MSENSTPKGYVGLFIDPDGRVHCQAACFDESINSQQYRCQQNLYRAIAEHWLWPFRDCISPWTIEQIVTSAKPAGWKMVFIPVGQEEDKDDPSNP